MQTSFKVILKFGQYKIRKLCCQFSLAQLEIKRLLYKSICSSHEKNKKKINTEQENFLDRMELGGDVFCE